MAPLGETGPEAARPAMDATTTAPAAAPAAAAGTPAAAPAAAPAVQEVHFPEQPSAEQGPAAAGGASGAQGYSAPIVKVESDDPEKVGAAADTGPTDGDGAKAEDEVPDFGGPGADEPQDAARGPSRAMPDYGDLIDDVESSSMAQRGAPKEEEGGRCRTDIKPESRPTAMHISGVQRLNRGHLAEVFSSKKLPLFVRLDWLSDDQVLCIFPDGASAATALAGARAGFMNVSLSGDALPGPGLWRAQRCMLEFREATTTDVPDPSNRRLHRAGRQVREFRFWGALVDQTKDCLDIDESRGGVKRFLPSGEDAIAAAEWDDFSTGRGSKRRRVGQVTAGSDEEPIDMLEQMASLDKEILAKQEDVDAPVIPPASDMSLVNVQWDDEEGLKKESKKEKGGNDDDDAWWGGDSWGQQQNWRGAEMRAESDSWWHGGGGGGGRRGSGNWHERDPSWGRWADDDSGGWNRKRQRGSGKAGGGRGQEAAQGHVLSEEEQAKRAKRSLRFRTHDVSAEGAQTGEAKEEVPAR